ncbi:MAG: carboxymuconolactone decarboxylase family protein [Gemmatimonadota bacterium]|nr:carboxymuconolactone decarboxylase family protein [Gemmatimonadota bacterium]
MDSEGLFNDSMRALIRIAATTAGSPIGFTRRALSEAVGLVSPAEVDELLLQSYLFAGFPRTLNAAKIWRELSGEVASDTGAPDERDSAELRAVGEATCREVYGIKYDALREAVRQLHPALDDWMVTDGYGKVLSRPGLTLAQRELCIVAACAASEQLPQLKAHMRGALNCGASHEDLAQTLSALTDIVPREALAAARDELTRIRES